MNKQSNESLNTAEQFLREQTALYRHYSISEVQANVEQFTGVSLSADEAVELVQGIRDEQGMGAIDEYNLPGYVDEDETSDQEDQVGQSGRGGFFGWFRR